MESKTIKYNSNIWKYFKIQENFDMCKECKKILLGEEDLLTLRKHLNSYHQINIFDEGKFPVCTIPFLHDHFRIETMATCTYCYKTENYLKILDKLRIHVICAHRESYLLTENIYKILTLSEVECDRCRIIGMRVHYMHSSLIRHLEVKHPEKLPYDE